MSKQSSRLIWLGRQTSVMFVGVALSLVAMTLGIRGLASKVAAQPPGNREIRPQPRTFGAGSLRMVGGLRLVEIEGTPVERGAQLAELTREANPPQQRYLEGIREELGRQRWLYVRNIANEMAEKIPPAHLEELDAFAEAGAQHGATRENLIVAQSAFDIMKFGCSTLIVDAERSAVDGPLMGRNFDYNSQDVLQRCGYVTVVRGSDCRAFVMVGWPWTLGPITGMNDAGLCVAVNEAYDAADGSPKVDVEGVPRPQFVRRILEECATLDEAEALAREMPRTCQFSLTLCDLQGGRVLELTPVTVVARPTEQGIGCCTNHFCADELAVDDLSFDGQTLERMTKLNATRKQRKKLGVADVLTKLDDVNLGPLTLYSVIFEPRSLRIHVAMGELPATKGKLVAIDCRELFRAGADRAQAVAQ